MQICTRLLWRNAMFWKRRFRIVWPYSLNLHVLSLLCAWARHFKTRTQRRQCCPLLKLLLIKKIYHLNTLHIYPAKTNKDSKTNKGRVTEFLYQALELRRPIVRFLQKTRAWSRSKSLWPITTLLQITHYTRPNYTDRPQMNIHCIEKFFTVHDFWATCACPEKKQSCPENFHCSE